MKWIDGLENKPTKDDGIYLALCASQEGAAMKMASFKDGKWITNGSEEKGVAYYARIDLSEVPGDAGIKAQQLFFELQKATEIPPEDDLIFDIPDDEVDLVPAEELLGAEE